MMLMRVCRSMLDHRRPPKHGITGGRKRSLFLEPLEDRLLLATWDGKLDTGGMDPGTTFWMNRFNWVGDILPMPGEDLVFPGSSRPTNINDFPPGTTFGTMILSGRGYDISGAAIDLTGGLIATVDLGINTVALSIGGPGGLTKSGSAILELAGASANTYTGDTNVNEGTLVLRKTVDDGAIPGTLVIGDGVGSAFVVTSNTVVMGLSTTSFSGNALLSAVDDFYNGRALKFTSGPLVGQPANVIDYVGASRTFTVAPAFTSVPMAGASFIIHDIGAAIVAKTSVEGQIADDSSVVTMSDGLLDLYFAPPLNTQELIGSLAGNGLVNINTAGGTLITGGNDLSTEFSGLIEGPGNLNKQGSGDFSLSGNNTYTGLTTVDDGGLFVNGVQPASSVVVNVFGVLGGRGITGDITSISGNIDPGTVADVTDVLTAIDVSFRAPNSTYKSRPRHTMQAAHWRKPSWMEASRS